MNSEQREWVRARDELVSSVIGLGFPQELGNEIAKNLGSPKAMRRMTAYLGYVKPTKEEMIRSVNRPNRHELKFMPKRTICMLFPG